MHIVHPIIHRCCKRLFLTVRGWCASNLNFYFYSSMRRDWASLWSTTSHHLATRSSLQFECSIRSGYLGFYILQLVLHYRSSFVVRRTTSRANQLGTVAMKMVHELLIYRRETLVRDILLNIIIFWSQKSTRLFLVQTYSTWICLFNWIRVTRPKLVLPELDISCFAVWIHWNCPNLLWAPVISRISF